MTENEDKIDIKIGSKAENLWQKNRIAIEQRIEAEEMQLELDMVILEYMKTREAEEHEKFLAQEKPAEEKTPEGVT